MRKRVAILFDGDIYSQRGQFNAIRNRIKHLKAIADYEIDVFAISVYEPWYIRILRNTAKVQLPQSIVLDGVSCQIIWRCFSLVDYILEVRCNKPPFIQKIFERKVIKLIHGYDLISAHSTMCGRIASRISERDHIPFYVTWHGSDIHTTPFVNPSLYAETQLLLQKAACNFFVSNNLQSTGQRICSNMTSLVLYNGVNDSFHRFLPEGRIKVRQEYNLNNEDKVVAFVGGLIEVKNPQLLPLIFEAVIKKYNNRHLNFWIVGSGKMENVVRQECDEKGVPCIFWGNQAPEAMPSFMNCIDVLVLPSRNEGLPLVTVEALACGANVVGSDVGGISEAIGEENVFSQDDSFIDNISSRIALMLSQHVEQSLRDVFSWVKTAEIENSVYHDSLK